MTVYKKLMQARIKLQTTKLQKTGHNKFAGYTYFELGDFLPQIQGIFNEVGLCGVISFAEELATLTITDVEDSTQQIILTSPMKEANLKGCHPVQNLGAVETYTRRYLWVSALEIVEHDAIEAATGKDEQKEKFDVGSWIESLNLCTTLDQLKTTYTSAIQNKMSQADRKEIDSTKDKMKIKLDSVK